MERKLSPPGWRPSWVWYLAEAPALSAVACNSVPALTLLSGSTPPEKNTLSLCGGERHGARLIKMRSLATSLAKIRLPCRLAKKNVKSSLQNRILVFSTVFRQETPSFRTGGGGGARWTRWTRFRGSRCILGFHQSCDLT